MSIRIIISTIDAEIAGLQKARALLSEDNGNKTKSLNTSSNRPKSKLSAAGRKRIADAQRKRWAALKKAAKA